MKKLILSCLLTLPLFVNAGWKLDNGHSNINFMSTKKEHIVEIHKFDKFDAVINDNGEAKLTINLASVNTMIPIRNERMQKFLFETTRFANATLSAKLDSKQLSAMKLGDNIYKQIQATLDLHGITQSLTIDLLVTSTKNGLLFQNTKPVLIDSRSFELTAGVDKLKSLAKLPSIGYTVPVSFSLLMKK